MNTLIEIWRSIVGAPVDYFTVGSSNSIQWHYGHLLEYCFVALAAIIVIALVFRFIFMLIGLFGHKH